MDIPTKEFKINIDGIEETIVYKTDLDFGEIQSLLKATYDAKNPLAPKFDGLLYQRMVMEYAIVKAPFDPKDYSTIYKLKGDIVNEIIMVLMKTFPLARFLAPHSEMLKEFTKSQKS